MWGKSNIRNSRAKCHRQEVRLPKVKIEKTTGTWGSAGRVYALFSVAGASRDVFPSALEKSFLRGYLPAGLIRET